MIEDMVKLMQRKTLSLARSEGVCLIIRSPVLWAESSKKGHHPKRASIGFYEFLFSSDET